MSTLYCIDFDYGWCSNRCYITSTDDLPLYEEHGYCRQIRRNVVWCDNKFVEDMVKAIREGEYYGREIRTKSS
jgi:hypothetical protein